MSPKTKINSDQNESSSNLSETSNEGFSLIDGEINEQIQSSDQLNLNLRWDERDNIILCLNKFSALLNGKNMKKDCKKELVKKNNYLIQRLSILPFSTSQSELTVDLDFVEENLAKTLKENVDEFDLFLELNWNKRDQIVNMLIKNYNFAILFSESVSNGLKKTLLKENNDLVVLLLALEVKPVDKIRLINESGDVTINATDDQNDSDLKEKILNLEKRVNQMNCATIEESLRLNKRINEIDPKSKEVTFAFEIKKASDFLFSKRKLIKSETFYCSSLPFCLRLKSLHKNDKGNFLEFYLKCLNVEPDIDWSIKLNYTARLVSQSDDGKDIIEEEKDVIFLKESSSWGNPMFASYSVLDYFVKDDTIKVEVNIKADNVLKSKTI